MNIYAVKFGFEIYSSNQWTLLCKVQLYLAKFYFPGWVGGWGKIKIKDQLSPAEAETGAELGNITKWML